ncbi:hypothetical protein [Chengkuizengella axinellae]|uniref:Cardiolipin synthase N-terminal domain-containing protein n=1 Tax=Chengkuizengella axinellae TaxID=3064388 RepID=A0ABT9IUG8_9BACL|nr:hypothetical protein [Chengkuizengella sp. 2205SS18-9]MDP5272952.1 hypothetical protein [Chengkuizengella sp. 2205SS18-9]
MEVIIAVYYVLWFFSIVGLIWLWADATEKRGTNIGCLWALVVLILGPIAFIAYLFVRKAD